MAVSTTPTVLMRRLNGLFSANFAVIILLSSCVSVTKFDSSGLTCQHTVSAQILGTGQVITCEKDNQIVHINSFPGTSMIEPLEKAAEAGAIIGGTIILAKPRQDGIKIHVGP